MIAITDSRQAGERLMTYAREGRLVQGAWQDEHDGREVACLLGAAAGITGAQQCPASLMPSWVAHALPALFDGQTWEHAQTFARRWGEAMTRPEWASIAWDDVRAEWMAFVVSQAKNAAAYAAADAAADAVAYAAAAAYAAAKYADADAAVAAARYAAAADAAAARDAARDAARAAARDAQADALMAEIERAMEVARG
jgi:hypothetical protein